MRRGRAAEGAEQGYCWEVRGPATALFSRRQGAFGNGPGQEDGCASKEPRLDTVPNWRDHSCGAVTFLKLQRERERSSGALERSTTGTERAATSCGSRANAEASECSSRWGSRLFEQAPRLG
jgi:hypothetical protein